MKNSASDNFEMLSIKQEKKWGSWTNQTHPFSLISGKYKFRLIKSALIKTLTEGKEVKT